MLVEQAEAEVFNGCPEKFREKLVVNEKIRKNRFKNVKISVPRLSRWQAKECAHKYAGDYNPIVCFVLFCLK